MLTSSDVVSEVIVQAIRTDEGFNGYNGVSGRPCLADIRVDHLVMRIRTY